MNLNLSDETRRQLFGKSKANRSSKHLLSPPTTTFQSLNTDDVLETPAILASSPVRCSLGKKDRPAGWQNLLERRLQKGSLSSITMTAVNKKSVVVPNSSRVNIKANALTVAEKANAAHKKKKNIKDEIKRQSALAAAAAAAASSPEYIHTLNEQMKASEMKRSSLVRNAPIQPSCSPRNAFIPKKSQPKQRVSLDATSNISMDEEQFEVTLYNRRASTGSSVKSNPMNQQKEDLYYEPSPMCRLRTTPVDSGKSGGIVLRRFQDLSGEKIINQVDVKVKSDKINNSGMNQDANDENGGDACNQKKAVETANENGAKSKKSGKKVFQSAAASIVDGILAKSAGNEFSEGGSSKLLPMMQTSNDKESVVPKAQSLLGFRNKDFGNTQRSLLSTKDPRIEIEKSLLKEKVQVENVNIPTTKSIEVSPKQRRADRIQNHKCNVGSTLKSIGIELNKPIVPRMHKEMPLTTSTPNKKKATLRNFISSKRRTNRQHKRLYKTMRTKRCLLVQARRGVAEPTVRKVSYQRYSFLERKRRGILKSGLIKTRNKENSSSNTVVSIDSTSSSYCEEMLAHAKELRKARLSLVKQLGAPLIENPSIESVSNEEVPSVQAAENNYEMVSQVVKRRKSRLTLSKLNNDVSIGMTLSSESQTTTASTKRSRAMEKVRRNKLKALQRDS
jgi:hypothetical protein